MATENKELISVIRDLVKVNQNIASELKTTYRAIKELSDHVFKLKEEIRNHTETINQ